MVAGEVVTEGEEVEEAEVEVEAVLETEDPNKSEKMKSVMRQKYPHLGQNFQLEVLVVADH